MCTFNIALDDSIVEKARLSFADDKSMTEWIQEQVATLLMNRRSAAAMRMQAIDQFFGGWSEDPRSTEEILSDVRNARTQNSFFDQ